jgi:hypothetical protein
MPHTNDEPHGWQARGARKIVQAGSSNTSDNSLTLSDLQASWLARRARVSLERARLCAEQIFGDGRRA